MGSGFFSGYRLGLLKMLLQGGKRVLCELGDVIVAFRSGLELTNSFLVSLDHGLCKLTIKFRTRQRGEMLLSFLVDRLGLIRWRDTVRLSE